MVTLGEGRRGEPPSATSLLDHRYVRSARVLHPDDVVARIDMEISPVTARDIGDKR